MPDFSTILQTPEVRQVVQDNLLERAFHDALFPGLLYRGEAVPQPWPLNSGDTQIFSAPGLITPKQRPLQPGVDPAPSGYTVEQWTATLQQYADSIDTHMPTSIAAIIDLFMRNAHQLGMSASQALNRIVRDRMFNAALSGWTVTKTGYTGGSSTSLPVQALNGFTTARNPNLSGGSKVRFDPVSASNPLTIDIEGLGANTVVGFTPDNAGDTVGPGTLILGTAVTIGTARRYVRAVDRSNIVRVGGGNKVDDVGNTDLLNLASLRQAVASFWQNNVPTHVDGRFHGHIDPTAISQVYEDDEFQRLNTSLPDYVIYRQFALGEILNVVFFRNTESPVVQTVQTVNNDGVTYSVDDQFAGELYNTGASTGTPIHRTLITAQGGIYEYYQDMMALITDAGLNGKVADPRIVNNGIEVMSDRIQLIIRGPLNRLQDLVSTSWKFLGDWPARTDASTGDAARYKRFIAIESGQA